MVFKQITREQAQQTNDPKMYVVYCTVDGEKRGFGIEATKESELFSALMKKFGVVDPAYHEIHIDYFRIGLTTNSHVLTV